MQFTKPTLEIEQSLWKKGLDHLAGVDEVGRGAFAGPVVAAAVILPKNFQIPDNFADSKQLRPKERKQFAELIKKEAKAWAIAEVGVSVIDKLGLGKAAQKAFRKALKDLKPVADFVLVDAFYIKHLNRKNQKPIIKGDQKSVSIAAASIIAKVHRDKIMRQYHKKYPKYGFGKHKGYGTKFHQVAIKKFGLTTIHRRQFIHFL